jgi:hypothetical protein
MRWARHVAQMGEEKKNVYRYWWESQREGDCKEDQDVGEWILEWILEKWDGVIWTKLV